MAIHPGSSKPAKGGVLAEVLQGALAHPALRHPFLMRFAAEPLSREQIVRYALEHYSYSRVFAKNLAAVVSNVADEAARNLLVLNMYEEIGEPSKIREQLNIYLIEEGIISGQMLGMAMEQALRGPKKSDITAFLVENNLVTLEQVEAVLERRMKAASERTHPALFRRFLRALGLTPREIKGLTPLPETLEFVRVFEELCREADWIEGLGAIGPGTECVVPTIYQYILKGIEESRWVEPEDYIFWTLHVGCDDEHGQNILNVLEPYVRDEKAGKAVARGAQRILDARYIWFDALERHIFGSMSRSGTKADGVNAIGAAQSAWSEDSR